MQVGPNFRFKMMVRDTRLENQMKIACALRYGKIHGDDWVYVKFNEE